MSAAVFEFEAQVRDQVGKAAIRRLRHREDIVPAVVYGAGKPSVPITLLHKRVLRALEHEAVYSHILTLSINGQPEQVVLKDMLRHPSKPKIMHMDFFRVSATKELTMHVPLHFIGEEAAPGIKDGGVLSKLATDLEISCLPADLPEYIEVDISRLGMHESIRLSEIKLPKGVSLLHPVEDEEHDQAVANIHQPRVSEEAEEAAEAEAAAAAAEPVTEPAEGEVEVSEEESAEKSD